MLGSTHIAYQLLFSENGSIQTLSYSFEFVVVVGGGCGFGLVYQIQNAPVKQGDNAPNESKCSKPMKGM